jgi:hypothetical protein
LEVAHQFLATFGITKPTHDYNRWVKCYGFDRGDFNIVLGDSPFIFTIDWRADLQFELKAIVEALARLGVELRLDFTPYADSGYVVCGGRRAPVKYVPSANDDFTDVILAIQSLVPNTIEFRASPANGQNDSSEFAVLPVDEWLELESLDRELINDLFQPMCRTSKQGFLGRWQAIARRFTFRNRRDESPER